MASQKHYIAFAVTILSLISMSRADSFECQNAGSRNDNACSCLPGFYGPICNEYADSYELSYNVAPVYPLQLINQLATDLELLKVYDVKQFKIGNAFKLSFYKKLSATDVLEIKSVANNAADTIENARKLPGVTRMIVNGDLVDFNECSATEWRQSCGTRSCANTDGSFRCGCNEGYKVENFECVKDVDNTKEVIYIWSGVVAAVVFIMLGFIIFYRWKKIEKGKKIQQEHEEKLKARTSSLTPTNLNELDQVHIRRSSPGSSIFEGPIIPPRRMSYAYPPPDASSVYSYGSRMYPMSEPDYALRNPDFSRHRLSAPVLDSAPMFGLGENPGYEYDMPKYSSSLPQTTDGTSYLGEPSSDVIPTSFPSDMPPTRDDRYDQY